VVLKVGGISLLGSDFEGQRDEKTNKGVIEGVKMLDHYSMIELSSVA